MFEADIDPRPIRAESESVGPFDDDDGLLRERFFEAEGFEIREVFNAIEIDVIDRARGRALLGAR